MIDVSSPIGLEMGAVQTYEARRFGNRLALDPRLLAPSVADRELLLMAQVDRVVMELQAQLNTARVLPADRLRLTVHADVDTLPEFLGGIRLPVGSDHVRVWVPR